MSVKTPAPDVQSAVPAADSAPLASDLRVAVGRLIRRLRASYAFPLTQASVLGRLDREGPQYIGELASAEGVRPQSMSQTLAELEADGLIARSPDANDGRRTRIELTDSGRAAIESDRAKRDGWLAQEISSFTAEERRLLDQVVPLLERLASS